MSNSSGSIGSLTNGRVTENTRGGLAIDSADGSIASLVNDGRMMGGVSLGADDALTNSGQIDGNLILASADTVNDEGGTISGPIYASANDLLSFSGYDGAVTIDNFVASGAAHDTLLLSAGGAMTQVGSDVVIKRDETDSITLVGVSLASFTAADLKLGPVFR
jgi:hypothetical protein